MTSTPAGAGRVEQLDPLVRRLFVGVALSALGSGLTLPFLYVYLAEVRGIGTSTVGLLLAWMGVVGLAVSPVMGSLIDRVGPRRVILGCLAGEAAGVALLGLVTTPRAALAVLGLVSLSQAGMWPATTALLTRLVPERSRERAYGLQFMLLNAGLGIGGLLSALMVRVDDPGSFVRLYLLDALTFLGFLVVVASLPRAAGAPPPRAPAGEEHTVVLPRGLLDAPASGGWAEVVRDRTLRRVALIAVLLVTFGYAQVQTGFAAYAVEVAEIPARSLGLAFAANTVVIVAGQIVVLRWIRGRRRSRTLAVAAGVWALSWTVVALSAPVGGWFAVLLVIAGLALFGLGETLWAPVAPALVNGLAPEHLRGRYNALFGATWTVSMILGPAVAGLLIGNGLAALWVLCTVGGGLLGVHFLRDLGRHLTGAQDGLDAVPARRD